MRAKWGGPGGVYRALSGHQTRSWSLLRTQDSLSFPQILNDYPHGPGAVLAWEMVVATTKAL